MAFGFPARFTARRKFHLPPAELLAVVRVALESLGWSYQVVGETEVVAAMHNSPMTFGEEVRARIQPDGVVQVESRCVRGGMYRMPQIFDFGANRKNVESLLGEVERRAGAGSSGGEI